MKETALIPIEKLACFVILAESEGVGIDKQCVCFVLAAELLVLHGMTWGMQRGLSTVFFKEALFLNVYKVGYWRKRLEICNRKIADIGFFLCVKIAMFKENRFVKSQRKSFGFFPPGITTSEKELIMLSIIAFLLNLYDPWFTVRLLPTHVLGLEMHM